MLINENDLFKEYKKIRSPARFLVWSLWKFPSSRFAGLRIDRLDNDACIVSIPGGWRSQNPFKSMYWAVQGMGAELATAGVPLAIVRSIPENVRTLVAGQQSKFIKKAKGRISFTCEDGHLAMEAIERSMKNGKSVNVDISATGHDASGDVVSEWIFNWNFLVS